VAFALSNAMNSSRDHGPGHSRVLTIPSDPAEARRLQEEIEQLLRRNHFCDHDIFAIKLALEEALINAIKHGNQMDPSKNVHITYHVLPDRFDIHITDEGRGFDPCDVPDPTIAENLERPCGRGLMLMRYYMSQVTFDAAGNSVRMTKVSRNGKQ
jgi:serine/threonine-protein kinase RsbW